MCGRVDFVCRVLSVSGFSALSDPYNQRHEGTSHNLLTDFTTTISGSEDGAETPGRPRRPDLVYWPCLSAHGL